MVKYELEKCRRVGDEDSHTSQEWTIAESDNIDELKEIAKTIKLKGNKYRREELRIIEIDEHGDIVDYRFIERRRSG